TVDGKELTGAMITLDNGTVISKSDSELPKGKDTIALNADGSFSDVMIAGPKTGSGTYLLRWGDVENAAKSIRLEVPGKTTKVADKYSTKLNWTLMDVPSF